MASLNEILKTTETVLRDLNNIESLKDIEFRYLNPAAYKLNGLGMFTYHWMILSNYDLTNDITSNTFFGKTKQFLLNQLPIVTGDSYSFNQVKTDEELVILFYKTFSNDFNNTYIKTPIQGYSTPHIQYFGGNGDMFNVECLVGPAISTTVGVLHNSAKIQMLKDLIKSGNLLYINSPMFNIDYNVFEIAVESVSIKPYSDSSIMSINLSFINVGDEDYFEGYGENSSFYKNYIAEKSV